MHYTTALALASTAGLAVARPSQLTSRTLATFPAGSSWDILLNIGDSDSSVSNIASGSYAAIDIDLFDNDRAAITALKNANKKVICYFSAGSREDWRADADDFQGGDVGQAMGDWEGENWLNVQSANVRAIMKQRIQQAADKGCTAVDPDNVDGYNNNQDGFGYDKEAYVDYMKYLATEAKALNLAIGLKNGVEMINDLVSVVQFAVNEQCHGYEGECARYEPFTTANKAVFNIEYGNSSDACTSPSGVKLSTLVKSEDQDLNALGGACSA